MCGGDDRKKPTQWMIFAEIIIGAFVTQETFHCVEKKFDAGVDEAFRFP